MLAISWEGIIATPFGYLIDLMYQMVGNYGLTIILFAFIVQAIMVPIGIKNSRDREKKRKLQPLIEKIREEYADNIDKQTDLITELYNKEKISLAGGFILAILPFFILIPIFQVLAQPITYMFHESPETAKEIIRIMREQAPDLFASGYNQVTAIAHIRDFADVIRTELPDHLTVAERTLQGIDYKFLGVDLSVVLGAHILGRGVWSWDWAHIGALLLPIVYVGRRTYLIFAGMIRSLVAYSKKKKEAKRLALTPPKTPNPPLLALLFLLLSVMAMTTVPVSMDLYWLAGALATAAFRKLHSKIQANRVTAKATAEIRD